MTPILILGFLVTVPIVLHAAAALRWRSRTTALVRRLKQAGMLAPPARFAVADLAGLPPPVARYLRTVLTEGQPLVRHARLTQRGQFLVRPTAQGWRPFVATEHFVTHPGGFVWDARIRLAPGFAIHVRDAFVGGVGSMLASLAALWRMVSVEGTPGIAAGALHRYLAEAVWFPTALLPGQGVAWTPIDERSARATLGIAGTTVSLDFQFGVDGLVSGVFTPARARDVDGRLLSTPWQGHFSRYAQRGAMKIPLAGEVEWVLPDGPQPYWRGEITTAVYTPG
jgi:hypothetical protein